MPLLQGRGPPKAFMCKVFESKSQVWGLSESCILKWFDKPLRVGGFNQVRRCSYYTIREPEGQLSPVHRGCGMESRRTHHFKRDFHVSAQRDEMPWGATNQFRVQQQHPSPLDEHTKESTGAVQTMTLIAALT